MHNTLKMMKSILTGKEGKVDEKELIEEYQESLSPNILAYFYSNNFGIIYKTSRLYPILNEEDTASFCLQELDECLKRYDKKSNTKFITYFITCYKRRLWAEKEMLYHNIRKINLNTINVDELDISSNKELALEDIDLICNQYKLTESEVKQCKLLNMGYTIKEIANLLKLKPSTIYSRNTKIKQKILNLDINFT